MKPVEIVGPAIGWWGFLAMIAGGALAAIPAGHALNKLCDRLDETEKSGPTAKPDRS